jgi:hypothetical protein
MPDVDYSNSSTWNAGDLIEVKINGVTSFNYAVPIGKKMYGVILIQGNEK